MGGYIEEAIEEKSEGHHGARLLLSEVYRLRGAEGFRSFCLKVPHVRGASLWKMYCEKRSTYTKGSYCFSNFAEEVLNETKP